MESFPPSSSLVYGSPRRLTDVDSWHEHIPFAFYAVESLRPRTIVELGTWKGDSYCALCQAVQALGSSARCAAVDSWQGDEHTGPYGPEVLEELRAYHDPLYGAFSRLLQQSFDEAAAGFPDGSIDLLHIDGCHTYEAVAHDVATWLPKLSDRGVLLLHDTDEREPGFGVWRLWDELAPGTPSFAFTHGHGLGVLAVGANVEEQFVQLLRRAGRDAAVSRFFAALGERVAAAASGRRSLAASASELQAVSAEREQAIRMAELQEARFGRSESERRQTAEELRRATEETDRLRSERDRLAAALRARERDLAEVIRSPSWRLTAPLRSAKRNLLHARYGLRRLRRRQLAPGGRRSPKQAAAAAPTAAELRYRPLVSVITPVYETDPRWLQRAVDSVRAQTYPHWQLCLADDGSTSEATLACLASLAGDPAIRVSHGENGGIAAATNRALASAEGEFVAFLDHDDELVPDALLACVSRLNERPQTDVVYTDEDKIDRRNRPSEPFFKPDWSPELFRGVMYVGHLLVARRSLVEEAGGLDPAFDGVQDYELMLRFAERTDRIEHVSRILYHWRKLPGSLAATVDAKPDISRLQAAAVNAHLERCGVAAFAQPHPTLPHRATIHPRPRSRWPRATVIVPTRDAPAQLGKCLVSIFTRTTYPNFSVLLVDNGTMDPEARALFEQYPVDVVPFGEPFNFSRVNNVGAAAADGELLVFLNNDTEVRTPEWLEVLASLAERDGVGAVGPLLRLPERHGPARRGRPRAPRDGRSHHARLSERGRRLRRLALLHT